MTEWSMNQPPTTVKGYVEYLGEFPKFGKITINISDWGGPNSGYSYTFQQRQPKAKVMSLADLEFFGSYTIRVPGKVKKEVPCGPGGKGTREVMVNSEVEKKLFKITRA